MVNAIENILPGLVTYDYCTANKANFNIGSAQSRALCHPYFVNTWWAVIDSWFGYSRSLLRAVGGRRDDGGIV